MKGHKLNLERTGAESGFYHGTCECGWYYKGVFAATKKPIRDAHKDHLDSVAGIEPEWIRQAKARSEK